MEANYSKFFPVLDYYEKVVVPINPKRFRVSSDKMICPFHMDTDPSLGVIVKKDGRELCHCFGCNYWGDIIRLHQSVSKKYYRKYLEPEESLVELCRIFGVSIDSVPAIGTPGGDLEERQESDLIKAMEGFDIGDFKYLIQKGKKEKRGIGYFNALTMSMVDTIKKNGDN